MIDTLHQAIHETGMLHTAIKRATGYDLPHISTGDFWTGVAIAITAMKGLEELFHWKLGVTHLYNWVKSLLTGSVARDQQFQEFKEFVTEKLTAVREDQLERTAASNEYQAKILSKVDIINNSIETLQTNQKRLMSEVIIDGDECKLKDRVIAIHNEQVVVKAALDAKMDSDPMPTFKTDPNNNLYYANPAFLKLTGVGSLKEIIGTAWLTKIIPPRLRAEVKASHENFTVNAAEYHDLFTYMNAKTKQEFTAFVNTTRVYEADGKTLRYTLGTVTFPPPID
jgi:PAS domain S-box-containing protein